MRRRILCLLLILLLALPPGPARSDAPASAVFWRTAGHDEASSWQWTARPGFFDLGLVIWESGQVASPGQGTVRGTYTVDMGSCHVDGSYEERRRARGDDVLVQRVYRETFVDAYPQAPGDSLPNERTWTVAGTARTLQSPLSPLYGRPALPTSPGLVRRAQTAPRRVRPLVQAWAGARHQAASLRDYLVTTGSPPDRQPIPWVGTWSYQGAPRRCRSAIPGVDWPHTAEPVRYAGSLAVRVTVPPNLPWAWQPHHGPLPGVQVANVVPGSRVAASAIPALGPWRLTLATPGAHVFAADGVAEVCLPLHAELLLAWWGLMPLGSWEPGVGLWGHFMARNGALKEWGLDETDASWPAEWAALVQRNRLHWSGESEIAVDGWRCVVDPLATRP